MALRYPRTLLDNRDTARHQKAVDTKTGRIVGYIRWSLPPGHGNLSEAWPEAQIPPVSAEEEAEIRRVAETAVWDPSSDTDPLDVEVGRIKEEMLARKPYINLEYLAVHPDFQRRGIATALVKSGMKEAEKLGLDIFILAFKQGVQVYRHLGFRTEKELIQDDSVYGGPGELASYFMVYEQQPGILPSQCQLMASDCAPDLGVIPELRVC